MVVLEKSPSPARLGLTPRRAPAAAQGEAARSLQRFVRQGQWGDLRPGDVVRVAGHTPRGRHWRFRAHVTNTSNGASWVEVALVDGPSPSKRPTAESSEDSLRVEKVRSFEPGLVTPRWRSRGRSRLLGRVSSQGAHAVGAKTKEPQAEQPSLF
jgi:hypothetical protein